MLAIFCLQNKKINCVKKEKKLHVVIVKTTDLVLEG